MNSGAEGPTIFFEHYKWSKVKNFCTKSMANDDFSAPPRCADSKNPIFIFFFLADFWVWVTSGARGSVSVGFWGARQLSPFFGGGLVRGLYRSPPPPPQLKARLPKRPLSRGPRSGSAESRRRNNAKRSCGWSAKRSESSSRRSGSGGCGSRRRRS